MLQFHGQYEIFMAIKKFNLDLKFIQINKIGCLNVYPSVHTRILLTGVS